jgi:hypothetical protein
LEGRITEYLAHLRIRLGCVLVMHQAAVLDGFALDALALQQDGLPPAEMSGVSAYGTPLARRG